MDRPKRVRFPKGKKVKPGDEVTSGSYVPEDRGLIDLTNPQLAAKERSKRRNQVNADFVIEESRRGLKDISAAEETYEVYSISVRAYPMASCICFSCSFPQTDESQRVST